MSANAAADERDPMGSLADRLRGLGVRRKAHSGHLVPKNVPLAHRLHNRRDYGWRMKINAMLAKRMSLEEIAARLDARKVPLAHGANTWTAASVRKAFVS